jgi:hypothetical protein
MSSKLFGNSVSAYFFTRTVMLVAVFSVLEQNFSTACKIIMKG